MRQLTHIDLSDLTTADFIDFIFDREVPARERQTRHWYRETKCHFGPTEVCSHLTILFERSGQLLERFSLDQLELGLAALQSRTPGCSARETIWSSAIPFEQRADCVRAMFYLFRDLFAVEPLHFTANMWWDVLCYDYELGRRKRSRGGDDLRMQEVMFETMFAILAIDSEECKNAAFHGLSHLHHPRTLESLKNSGPGLTFLDEAWCQEYEEGERRWAQSSQNRYPD